MDTRLIGLILIIGLLAVFYVGQDFSVFFYGGTTQGVGLDSNGIYGSPKTFAYATGELSSNSFGATFWTLKAKDAANFTKTGQDMTVFFYTYPNTCAFTLKEVTDPLNTAVIGAGAANLAQGKDYKVYDPETPTRNQKIDVMVLGPSDKEKQMSDALKNVLATMNSGIPVQPAQTVWGELKASTSYDYTFDAYRDGEAYVGPGNIYRIKFSGTHEGATDCFSLVDTDTYIIYSAKENKAYAIDRSKLSTFTSTLLLNSFAARPIPELNISSDDLRGKQYYVNSGKLNVVNDAPGKIQVSVIAPASVFYNPITGGISEDEQPGSEPGGIEFGGFGEPVPCDVKIDDIAFSADNTNRYLEGQQILTYVKVRNPGASTCLVSVTATAGKATIETKELSLAGYNSTQVPIQVKFGEIPSGELQDSVTYKACSSSVVSGTHCDQRSVGYTLLDKPVGWDAIDDGGSEPSPAPQPALTCQERARTRNCAYNDFACEMGKAWNEWSCADSFMPLVFGVGFGGFALLLAVVLVIAYWYKRR